jgi:lysophospholipase L1-like esterase
MKRILIACFLAAILGAAPAGAQLDLTRYVALGDSTSAGFTHGGLQDCYQLNSWPAVLARQAGVQDFELPLVSTPGLPQLLHLVHLEIVQGTPVPVIVPIGLEPGTPYNITLPRPYNALGVPGATLYDMLFTTGDALNLLMGNFDNAMHDLILRFPQAPGPGGVLMPTPAIAQAIGLDPTFVTVWIGFNDIFPAILAATPIEGVTMTPVEIFGLLFPQALGALVAQTSADVVVFTVLDAADTIPLVTSVPPLIEVPGLGIVPLQGTKGPLDPNSLVLAPAGELIAQGWGLPIPGSPPLPEDLNLVTGEPGYVLRRSEVKTIQQRTAAFNQIIRDTAAQLGVPVFDVNEFWHEAVEHGLHYGGIELNADFLVGGIVGFDGIHFQQIGDALLAMELIDFLNAELGADIEVIDLNDFLFDNPCAGEPAAVAKARNDVTLSTAAHKQLMDVFLRKLDKRPPSRLQRRGGRIGR